MFSFTTEFTETTEFFLFFSQKLCALSALRGEPPHNSSKNLNVLSIVLFRSIFFKFSFSLKKFCKYAKIGVMKKTVAPSKKTLSYQAYKRDFLWQILVPIIVALILVIAASVAVATGSDASTSRWADISTIWIIIPLLFSALITLILLGGIIYGMAKLLDITPIYTQKLTALIRLAAEKIEGVADASTKPIFFVEELSAKIKSIFQ